MKPLSPSIASELADLAYRAKEPSADGIMALEITPNVQKSFRFNVSKGPIMGTTGGFLPWLDDTTGFAIIGHGVNQYQNHIAIAIRGTKTLHDILTDMNFGLSTGPNGTYVHSGFNNAFESMRPALEERLARHLNGSSAGTVHCVGHSLGGALASLTADWLKQKYKRTPYLYTFGAPRVGIEPYAERSTSGNCRIFRCTHGADVVTKVPLWPFCHAPVSLPGEYRLDGDRGISYTAHAMGVTGTPGYRNTAKGNDWSQLKTASADFLDEPVRLRYEDRGQARFTADWADRLGAAVVTLLKDAGYYTLVATQATLGTALTFYDLLAKKMEEIAAASEKLADQARGLLGHMLAFAKEAVTTVTDLSFRFIRWVFSRTLTALYGAVQESLQEAGA